MRHFSWCTAAWGCLLALSLVTSSSVHAQSAADVEAALTRMHRWVGTNPNGMRWRSYLKSDQLSQQIDRGENADVAALQNVLAAYESGASGLDSPRFVAVRDSLAAWVDKLYVPPADELSSIAQAAKERFVPVGEEELASARRELEQSLSALNRFLAGGSAANTEAWHRFLHWDAIQTALGSGSADTAQLTEAWNQFRANEPGLELPQFVRVRDALRSYIDIAYYASDQELQAHYNALLDQLSGSLEKLNEESDDQLSSQIGLMIGQLERAGQAPRLVRAVRRNYSSPNLFFTVQDDVLRRGIAEPVDDVSDVYENILGVSVYSTAHTQGQVDVRMVPDDNRAVIEVLLNGVTNSENVGYKRQVTIYSTSETHVAGHRRIVIDENGLHGLAAGADCSTDTSINCISANMQLIQNLAWRQAMKKQGQAEAIASQRAERRVADRIDDQSQEMITNANADFRRQFREPLVRRGEFPERMEFSTTDNALRLVMLQASGQQLGTSEPPPEMDEALPMTLRVHESFAGNFGEAIIGGETLTDEKLVEMLEDSGREVPEELQITPDKDPWSITFTYLRPVQVTFADQTVRIAIRGSSFTRADQVLNETMEIAATYTLERADGGMKLTRQGDLDVSFVGQGGQLGARQVAFKTFMRRKWESLFKEEIQTQGIELPERFHGMRLVLEHLESDGGWISLGWSLGESQAGHVAANP